MARRAALFDLDKTLVRVNTAALYVRWQVRNGEARRRDFAKTLYWLGQYTLGVIDAETIVRQAARAMRGRAVDEFESKLRAWVDDEVMQHVSLSARREVERRRAAGDLCAVLTSSTTYSAVPLAEKLGIEDVLANQLEEHAGIFTGEIVNPLCYGAGKVAVAEQWARERDVDLANSVFFTDSISDRPMLERVGEPVAINPDPRLRLLAWRRGWRVERW